MDAFDAFIDAYQYHLAWATYLCAGLVFCLFWWRLTRHLANAGIRDLLRGLALVLMFTPWYVSEAREHLAPAVVVVLMDLLVGSTDNGLAGILLLLVMLGLMLAGLLIRLLLRRRSAISAGAAGTA